MLLCIQERTVINLTIGQRIRNRRLELGLSVDELAEKLEKNRATIYRYEKDDIKDLPTTVLIPLAKVLETTPADLMGWTEPDKSKGSSSTNMQRNISFFEEKLLSSFSQLNDSNKKKTINYTNSLLSAQQMEDELLAAHSRTDIDHTPDGQKHDLDIMDDDGKWK